MTREIPLIHPGEILLEDWLKPLGISQTALAKAIAVPPRRIHEIIAGKRAFCPLFYGCFSAFLFHRQTAGGLRHRHDFDAVDVHMRRALGYPKDGFGDVFRRQVIDVFV